MIIVWDAYGSCFAKSQLSDDQDQLLFFTYTFDKELRPILEEKLLITPATFGRMIRLQGPPEVGESAVSVDCSETSAVGAACRVTLTRAETNMGYTMSELSGEDYALQRVKEIQITRKDADIPKTLATAFRDCLRKMIPAPGDPSQLHPITIADDDRIEFWLDEPKGLTRKGERGEHPGKRTKALIHIGDLLVRYVEAASSDRMTIAKQIEEEASRILSKGNKPKKSR